MDHLKRVWQKFARNLDMLFTNHWSHSPWKYFWLPLYRKRSLVIDKGMQRPGAHFWALAGSQVIKMYHFLSDGRTQQMISWWGIAFVFRELISTAHIMSGSQEIPGKHFSQVYFSVLLCFRAFREKNGRIHFEIGFQTAGVNTTNTSTN